MADMEKGEKTMILPLIRLFFNKLLARYQYY